MMVKKLQHLLTKKGQWSLLFRSLIYTALLGAFSIKGSLFWAAFFIAVSIVFYFLESHERREFKVSYTLLSILSLLSLYFINTSLFLPANTLIGVKAVSVLILGFVYWALLGLINFRFEKREFVYTLMNTFVFILLFISTLSFMEPYSMGLAGVFLFFAVLVLFNEIFTFFRVSRSGFSLVRNKRMLVSALIMALISIEISWFIVMLPLSIINSAVLMTLFLVLGRDIVLAHFKGYLNLSFLLRQFTFLVLLTIIIFAASNWGI